MRLYDITSMPNRMFLKHHAYIVADNLAVAEILYERNYPDQQIKEVDILSLDVLVQDIKEKLDK